MGDAPAGTSLLQSHADIDHRDRNQQQQHHHQHRYLHSHSHKILHQRQFDSVVAQVTATVSVTQEIIVDQNGNTQGATLLPTSVTLDAPQVDATDFAPASATPALPTDSPVVPTDTPALQTAAPTAAPAAPTDAPPALPVTPLLTSTDLPAAATDASITPTDLPAAATDAPITPTDLPVPVTDVLNTSTDLSVTPVLPLTTPPPAIPSPTSGSDVLPGSHSSQSLITSQATPLTSTPYLGTNSSSSASSSFRSIPINPSNYTLSASDLASFTQGSTAESSVLGTATFDSPTSSPTGSSYASNLSTATVGGIGTAGNGPGATNSGSSSTSTAGAGAGAGTGATGASTGTGTPPLTSAVVGGVVGGIAGIVFIVALLMVIVRWRKRQQRHLRLSSSDSPVAGAAGRADGGGGPSKPGAMTQRSRGSIPFAIPATFASLTGYKRESVQPSVGASSTAGSEVGFVRIAGRKLPSVFQHGGDGYGDPHQSLSGSSFYRDSRGFYGGPGSPTSPQGFGRDSGIPVARPSPARTPVISEGAFGPPSPLSSPLDPPRRPGTLGRSHPSRDGSHGSKFMEDV